MSTDDEHEFTSEFKGMRTFIKGEDGKVTLQELDDEATDKCLKARFARIGRYIKKRKKLSMEITEDIEAERVDNREYQKNLTQAKKEGPRMDFFNKEFEKELNEGKSEYHAYRNARSRAAIKFKISIKQMENTIEKNTPS